MSTADGVQHPPAPAPGQGPGPEAGPIALPPAPLPAADATGPRPGRDRLDSLLGVLVLVLAFLAASFLARNSDLWFHLATGRLLAGGDFFFGADRFAYTTGGAYWANHSWLFDLGLYGLYDLAGGAALVVLKALLVTALAALLLRVRLPGGPAWVPVLCTTLAVVAMSPRLLLQPACVSYFLLGLTFWLLFRPHAQPVGSQQEAGGRRAGTAVCPLPPAYWLLLVFALWVNVDEWFFLGPVLAALFWAGERLAGQRRTPGWVVPAGLVACLLSPHTFHAFTLPPELSAVTWTSGLRQDVRFQARFASPWGSAYLHPTGQGPAALAYFALTFLGLLSFLLRPQALRGWRLAVWLPFALLAGWQARAIPFFAVVAAPVTALNLQDFLAARGRAPAGTGGRLVPLAGRLALALALLGLIFLTWPGWLEGYGREARHVAWGVQADPSLRRVAETLHSWRRQGLLRDGERVFALSPEVAQYGAWFCPGEGHFFDHRFALSPDAARDYEEVCRALQPDLAPGRTRGRGAGEEAAKDWRQVLRDHRVGVVVVYDPDVRRLLGTLGRLEGDPGHWTLLDVSGQAVVFGWNEARPGGGFAPLAFDAERLAFGPQDETVPEEGPDRLPPPRDFWDRLARPPAPPSWESAAATVYLHSFEVTEPRQRERERDRALRVFAAGLAGLPALPPALPLAAFELVSSRNVLFPPPSFLTRDQLGPYFRHLVDRSPALPLLAARAARRAVAANPHDPNAWLRLGQAYLLLGNLTCERSGEGLLPPLARLRRVQVATALEQAVRLNPDQEAAHRALTELYGERNLDQALEHRREELRLSRRAGPRPGETPEEGAYRLELLERDTTKMEELVGQRRTVYDAGARSLQGDRLAQAAMLLRLGLTRQALEEVLMPTPADLLGAPGWSLELDLLLTLGRVENVRPILGDRAVRARRQALGPYDLAPPREPDGRALYALSYQWPAYEWLHLLGSAAAGDYTEARQEVRALRAGLRTRHDALRRRLRDFERLSWLWLSGLLSGPPPFLPAFTAQTVTRVSRQLEAGERALRAQQADLCVLEGMLALEQGDTETARSAFAEARALGAPPGGTAVPFAGLPVATAYLGKLNAGE